MNKEIEWLLKDKYNFSDIEVLKFELNKNIPFNIQQDILRLENGEPINYIIGWQDFLDCKIDLSFKPLIPRVETEYWVKNEIDKLTTKYFSTLVENYNSSILNILDLCCGSGCIGISILKHIPYSNITFSDIDNNAINQINFNLNLNKIDINRYKVVKSDLFENIKGKFDIIFTNPPYVDKNDSVSDSLKFEPEIALFADNSGMEVIEKILSSFQKYLTPDGQLFMEFGHNQAEQIKNLMEKSGFKNFEFLQDQYDIGRCLKVNLSPRR